MRFVRRQRMTEEDVAASDTFEPGYPEPWDGDDVDYAIDRDGQARSMNATNSSSAARSPTSYRVNGRSVDRMWSKSS